MEKIRPDITSVLYPYTGLPWYVHQLKQADNGDLPYSFTEEHFSGGQRQYFPVIPRLNKFIDAAEMIHFLQNDSPQAKYRLDKNELISYIPSRKIRIPVTRQALIAHGLKAVQITGQDMYINIEITKNHLMLNEVLVIDLILQNNWERPLYFMSPYEMYELGLGDYLQQEGIVYRLMPYKVSDTKNENHFFINISETEDLLLEKYKWGNINKPEVYKDQTIQRQLAVFGYPRLFLQMADLYLQSDQSQEALAMLNMCHDLFGNGLLDDYLQIRLISLYSKAGDKEAANELTEEIKTKLSRELQYYSSLNFRNQSEFKEESGRAEYLFKLLHQPDLENQGGF